MVCLSDYGANWYRIKLKTIGDCTNNYIYYILYYIIYITPTSQLPPVYRVLTFLPRGSQCTSISAHPTQLYGSFLLLCCLWPFVASLLCIFKSHPYKRDHSVFLYFIFLFFYFTFYSFTLKWLFLACYLLVCWNLPGLVFFLRAASAWYSSACVYMCVYQYFLIHPSLCG